MKNPEDITASSLGAEKVIEINVKTHRLSVPFRAMADLLDHKTPKQNATSAQSGRLIDLIRDMKALAWEVFGEDLLQYQALPSDTDKLVEHTTKRLGEIKEATIKGAIIKEGTLTKGQSLGQSQDPPHGTGLGPIKEG